jgi:predicted nucleotidyltransferase
MSVRDGTDIATWPSRSRPRERRYRQLVEWLADRLAEVQGVVAVALGGSRAQGTERPDSDWDFGLYYEDTIDPDEIRALGYPGTVVAPGEWAYPMNGGAWLSIEGQKVDIHYRDLDEVRRWTEEAEQGRWELYRMPGYLCGMPSYALVAELALCRVLIGSLPRPEFPERLRETAPGRWRREAGFALQPADAHARRGDVAACLGKLSFAILAEAHARLCERREWVTSEKHLAERAELADTEKLLDVGRYADLSDMVVRVRAALSEAR